ncbi:MAG: hypothetical protein JW927_21030 [Deltaproteobacteria bacterium]|nr:hypothetical protein [Deltaproteobacteria bacterium]
MIKRYLALLILIVFTNTLCIKNAFSEQEEDGFVYIKGDKFYLDGKPFYFSGTNAFYLWYGSIDCASVSPNQGCVNQLLDSAKSLNLKVIRTWGSSEEIIKYGFCFQPSAG